METSFPSHWQLLPLDKVMDAIIDYRGKTPTKTDCGIPLVTAKIVKGGRILEPTEFIAEEDYESWMTRGLPLAGDIVITTEAPLGEVAQLLSANVALAQRIVTLRGKKGTLNNDFLLFAMQSSFVQNQLESRSSGSTVKGIKQSELRKIILQIPPEKEQLEIAKHLKSIDNKIELNTQTNQTLEQIAQAIFKSWFVDFDPVKAKIAVLNAGGTQDAAELAAMSTISSKDEAQLAQLKTQDADAYQQLAQIAALFPAAMYESELGDIPEGWKIGSIGEIAKAKGGFAFKSNDFTTEGNEVVKIKNITGDGRVDLDDCDYINDEVANKNYKCKLSDGDLLMAMTGATVGKVGIVATSGKSAYVNQRVAKFESDEFGKKISWFLYPCIQRQIVFDSIVGAAQGSAQPNISSSGIESTEIVLPTSALINHYCHKLDPYFQRWISNNTESRLLAQLRDATLPKLLSGEISLSDEELI